MNLKIKNRMIAYGESFPNEESGGFIWYDDSGSSGFDSSRNLAENKDKEFHFDERHYLRLFKTKHVYGIFHTHISDNNEFSAPDIKLAENLGLPLYLYNVKNKIWKEYLPKNLILNWYGNPFVWGFFDCYSLIRLYFWKKFNILLSDYDYNDLRNNNTNLILQQYEKEGFLRAHAIKEHDVIILGKDAPHHFGIYHKGNEFWDHKRDMISGKRVWNGDHFSRIFAVMRHKDLINY